MALKYKLDSLEGLDEVTAKLYKQSGDKFVLDTEDGPEEGDVAGLKANNERLLAEKKAAEKKLKELSDAQKDIDAKARKAAEDAARASGDTKALDESWKKKHEEEIAALRGDLEPKLASRDQYIRKLLIDNKAIALANEIAVPGSASVLVQHIANRLATEERDGEFVTVVRDAAGKPSAATIEDLKKEFVTNPAFAPVIQGSKASGGGAGGAKSGGAADDKTILRADFEKLDPVKRAEIAKSGVQILDSR